MSFSSFVERIAESAARHPDLPAIASGETELSYRELFALARGIRDLIVDQAAQQGAGEFSRIGIVTSDDVHTYASLLAVWSLGAAYVPLNVHNPPERNARIVEQAGLDLILTTRPPDAWPAHLPSDGDLPRMVATLDARPNDDDLDFPSVAPADLAYIFFTSGSTGAPKGVPISHGNVSAFMDTVLSHREHAFHSGDRVLQMFELTFDLSVVSILLPWSIGGCCCVVPEAGIAYMNILNLLAQRRVTVALMVPSVLPYLRRFFDEIRLPELRLSQFCGEALMQDMTAEWAECVPNALIENVYGPTEATIYCTRYVWDRDTAAAESVNGIVPIGRAMPGTRTVIVDGAGRPCPDGERGELCLAGAQVMSGYWQDPGKTAEAFVETVVDGSPIRAYRSGDIAFVNAHGNVVYCGRKDSQVKIDGHRVELGEIEFHARRFIGSSAAAVVLEADAAGVNRLRLFVAGDDIDRAGLERHLKENLPAYMRPYATTVMPELPLNLNGKIDRPALARLAAD